MSVGVRRLSGHWGGLRPGLSLGNLTLTDRRGKAAFQLERAEVTLSWWWLLLGELRFHDVEFHRPELVLRRGADGLVYLADKPLNAAGAEQDDGAFTRWLLSQRRLAIHEAALTWRDDFHGAPEVRLEGVEIQVSRRRGHHRAALVARPPGELARRIDLRADVVIRADGTAWRATGDAYLEALEADLGRLRAHLPVPETLRSGVGSVRVWLQFSPRGVGEMVADLAVRDARAQLAADALPLELAALSGRAIYRTQADGFTFATEALRFRLPNGLEARPGNFSLARRAPQGAVPRFELHADGIDLKIAAALVDYFPLPRDAKNTVLRFAPRGRLADAEVTWSDDGAKAYSVKGRFEDLALNAVDAMPGLAGFSGVIEGTQAGGTLRIEAKDARVELGRLLREPIRLDALDARARWRHDGGALEVAIEEARIANADAEGTVSGLWRALPRSGRASPGYVDLKGTFTRARVTRAAAYLPHVIAPARAWVEAAVQAGESPRLAFELKGDLWEFPFGGESRGRFLLEGEVKGGRLRYHPHWPSVDGIDGTIRFENRRMEIRAASARIFDSRVREASAVIEDLSARPPRLVIDGQVETTGGDSVRFLRESPLAAGPGAFTRVISVEGPARLALHIEYPLSGTEPVQVAGDYDFEGATASVARALALTDLHGRLSFTEAAVHAPRLAGTLFGAPATLVLATQPDRQVLATLEGAIDARSLAEFVPAPIAARVTGATAWRARVLAGGEGTRLTVSSDLQGMGVALPPPLSKAAADARAITLDISRLGRPDEAVAAEVAGGVYGRFSRAPVDGTERWHAALRFGSPLAAEPVREGLWLYGALPDLDVDAWLAIFAPAPGAAGAPRPEAALELRGVDMEVGHVRYLGREFLEMRAQLRRSGVQWAGRLESPLIAGDITWRGEGAGSLAARLQRFTIPEAAKGARTASGEALDLPALDIDAERFEFRGRHLGRLALRAAPDGREWRIERLDIEAPDAKFTSTGGWRRTGDGSITTLAVRLDANDLDALFTTFGYAGHLRRGSGHLEGSLAWPGQPQEFALRSLSGTLRVDARSGQFAKIEPGAGKLLALLSLQSLPRRALFDFRDVFSEGFAFDRIEGEVKVAKGVLLTEEFSISGPSAFVSLAGQASMPDETQELTVKVVPEVGEGMALAATVFGTPVLGLSTLIMSKLLRNPLGKAVSHEYQVTGTWDNPVVTRTSAPPPRAAAAPPVAPPTAAKTPQDARAP